MTMGDRITPTRPRRLDPPVTGDGTVTTPGPATGAATPLPTQPTPRPATDPVVASTS